jgi:hypothetical protein
MVNPLEMAGCYTSGWSLAYLAVMRADVLAKLEEVS